MMMKIIINNIYRNKSELMGLSIVMIIIFHTILPYNTPEFVKILKRYGEIGVDIFLLIGGFTVTASFIRSKSIFQFYKKRLIRILPAYILIWGIIYLVFNIRYSEGLLVYIRKLSLWNCIVNNDLRNWYIAAILIMYFITPFYIRLCQKYKYIMLFPIFITCINILLMCIGVFKELYLFMFWLRLPVYTIGVNLYLLKNKEWYINKYWLFLITLFSIIAAQLVINYNLTYEPYELRRLFYIPISLFVVYSYNYKNNFLAFIGTITLELYLLHEFIQGIIFDIIHPPLWIYCPVSILLSILLGYLINRSLNNLLTKIFI